MMNNDPTRASLESLLSNAVACARDMWLKGWAENGAGNLSIRVPPELLQGRSDLRDGSPWIDLETPVPPLAGAFLLLSATGSMFRRLRDEPRKGCGVIEIDGSGTRYRVVWGYESQGAPSSEMGAHLAVHAEKSREALTLVHVHAPNLVALTCSLGLNTVTLTRLLWSLHSECVVLFPEGVEVAPWCLPGSNDLSTSTVRALKARRMVVWPFHGVMAAGRNADEAMGLLEAGEKASEIYLKASTAGGVRATLGREDLRAIAAQFGVLPDEEILRSPDPVFQGIVESPESGGRQR